MTQQLPYVGLRPYEKTEATYFCGRSGEIAVLMDAFQEQAADRGKLLVIYGPSAVGKTSLVQAGLWPAARLAGDVAHLERFQPFYDETLEQFARRIRDYVGKLSGASSKRPLVFVDEIDQLFGYPLNGELDAETRTVLMKLLEFLAQATRRGMARVVFAVREPWSRFLEDAPRSLAFLESSMDFFRIGWMSSAGLEEFLRVPVARWQNRGHGRSIPIDTTFFEEFYTELSENPTTLPIANLMLEEAVSDSDTPKKLSHEAYTEIGGLLGYLLKHTEQVFSEWPKELQAKLPIFMELFRAAVTEESEFDVRCADSRVLVADPDARDVLGHLLLSRVLCLKGDRWEVSEVQVVHDKLFQAWERTAIEIAAVQEPVVEDLDVAS